MEEEQEVGPAGCLTMLFLSAPLLALRAWLAGYVIAAYFAWFGPLLPWTLPKVTHTAGTALMLLVAGLWTDETAAVLLRDPTKATWGSLFRGQLGLLVAWLFAWPLGWAMHWLW